jgi:hypothetical protein
MKAKFFLVVKNEDESYSVVGKSLNPVSGQDGSFAVSGDPDIELGFAKAELINGQVVISEDTEKKMDLDYEERGRVKMELAKRMRNFINGYNSQLSGFTEAETVATLTTFSLIDGLLVSGGLETARAQIAVADLTGTIYSEPDRTKFLEKIDEFISIYNAQFS